MSSRSPFLIRAALCTDKQGISRAAFSITTLSKNDSLGHGAALYGQALIPQIFIPFGVRNG